MFRSPSHHPDLAHEVKHRNQGYRDRDDVDQKGCPKVAQSIWWEALAPRLAALPPSTLRRHTRRPRCPDPVSHFLYSLFEHETVTHTEAEPAALRPKYAQAGGESGQSPSAVHLPGVRLIDL